MSTPSHKPKAQSGRSAKPRPEKLSSGSRPSAKPAPSAKPTAPLHVRWTGFRPLFDFWGNEIKRFYKLETLASATEYMISSKRDRWLLPGIQKVLGPAPVVSLSFELFQEGRYQLIFHLKALNAKRKQAEFAFVAAKQGDEFSRVAMAEHANLIALYRRAPEHIVKPFTGGTIYLPDRYGRVEKGREVYTYLTQWLSNYHELGVARNLQFFINVKTPHTFTIAQTEAVKAQMIDTIVRSYDAEKGECMSMPEIASGDFVVTWPKGRNAIPHIKLIACRKMLRRMTPVKVIDAIAAASWDWGGERLYLIPADPALLYGGFAAALGKEQARSWFEQYVQAVSNRRLRERNALPLETAKEIASGQITPAKF